MSENKRIRVLIADDSMMFREAFRRGLDAQADIEVIGVANDAIEAKDKILSLHPDVVTLDVEMPKMDGIKFLRKLMPIYPVPVIVISHLKESVFEALDAGAVDFVSKPGNLEDLSVFLKDIAVKIRTASKVQFAFRREKSEIVQIDLSPIGVCGEVDPTSVVAIGASIGGTEAIYSILSKFSKNMPGLVIVQHMPTDFTKRFAERLDQTCLIDVKEAEDGDRILPGRALVAPGGMQMRVKNASDGLYVSCQKEAKVSGHCPSVDVLFHSVAEVVGRKAVGVILTGMGADGSAGLLKIRQAGGRTIGQDEKSSVVYGMPMAAFVSGGVMLQLPLYRIPDELVRQVALLG
ncbi:MAG: chemotaxis response regulator protein-glutamate methylesterase [Clostridiales Family XIII bacterium]|jgi:two-component system chemotaxis response regulator CheB|nr:chemotaxis response regulator protein-glutamate methylesterase [Clostridiales Family XIII bacterium]